MALLFICATAYCAFFSIVPVFSFSIGTCILAGPVIEGATKNVNSLNEMNKQMPRNYNEMVKLFCSIIEDISDVKQLSNNISVALFS